jgi:hypothetical protein
LSILQKMLVAMLIISVVPPITLGYCASIDAKALGLSAANDAKWMGKHAREREVLLGESPGGSAATRG